MNTVDGYAWHDVTCPEGEDCRNRELHTSSLLLVHSGVVARFVRRRRELADRARVPHDQTYASLTWESRLHASPNAPCAALDESGDRVTLTFAAGVVRMTQSDRSHVAEQLRAAARLLDRS